MAKVNAKCQVTTPRAIAELYCIRPGDEIAWIPGGDGIRVVRQCRQDPPEDPELCLRLFDQATERHHRRSKRPKTKAAADRGWSRADLYSRGRAR